MTSQSELSTILELSKVLPEATAKLAAAVFDDLTTVEAFHSQVKHIYPSITRLRAHVSNRKENGLTAIGAVVENPGHPLLVRRSRFFDWLTAASA